MFGRNRPVSVRAMRAAPGVLMVNDIFLTVQGEGPDAGRPAVFIRLAKCSLKCFFCDTEFETGEMMPIENVIHEVLSRAATSPVRGRVNPSLVVITGGEPLLQDVTPLITRLNELGFSVSIETSGGLPDHAALPINFLFSPTRTYAGNLIVCSPKTVKIASWVAPLVGAWKYIIKHDQVAEDDGLPMYSTQKRAVVERIYRPPNLAAIAQQMVWVQPQDDGVAILNRENRAAAVASALKFGYRVSYQIHKELGLS